MMGKNRDNMAKTNKDTRQHIIAVLDAEDCWEHVIMNYLHFAPMRKSCVGNNPRNRRLHDRLNRAIGGIMQSWEQIQKGEKEAMKGEE